MAVPFYRHSLTPEAGARIAEVLASPFLTTGPQGARVEERLRGFFGVDHAKLTSSWTQGAIATLLAYGIGPDDEVIVPAMTFAATANVVRLVGATPVFVDVDPSTLLINRGLVAAALTPRTRAVIPVHLYGQMVDIPALRKVLPPSVRIIEDAAHCFEGSRFGRRPGQDGDAAIFSFYATKNVTCGEGGAVITNDPELARLLTQTVLHGMSAGAAQRFQGGSYKHWDIDRLGTKANLPDLLAVLLEPQIDTVEERLVKREALSLRYEKALAGTPFTWPTIAPGAVSARHLFPIHIPGDGRDAVLYALGQAGIGATVNYRSVPSLTYYRSTVEAPLVPVSQAWGEGTLSLPLFPDLRESEQDEVLAVLLSLADEMSLAKQPHRAAAE
ncbi:DegT/DnrJ/EryC1/StrS family aminotransferase [Methylobacterium brachythecii]|uniref:UDP-4-amino-4-deoxy-L-arabinose--oxoglutarate aminotransferase n=1 Tax=Methylobacterium brachythecii TaxID=1176177 RepID=A0A7W6F799_9HYPH|nr:DegT/DnrJ/EryC1/StrS aminotransferase family protein [Methylobacterium brachythecii]MBB3903169.1 UDP-4-amino-4-deoxy-L-arabinose-oxoglutarate aminotransferase [Methylobacterium brachythecii]GLS44750.1 UDP-4-amino-4-deoxy-L-arabinose--oxoglutarate aminotransferase [Methylobacterium brachythecii]